MEEKRLQDILPWIEGNLLKGDPGIRVKGISIDSRSLNPGELFLALPGKHYDGHDFISPALAKGACGVILERDISDLSPLSPAQAIIRVESSLGALRDIAVGYRNSLEITAIAVTGSNGKTTTKNLIGQLVGGIMKTLVSPSSYNNQIGVALTMFRIDATHQVAIFELGMNREGEILELGRICRPHIGVILNVGPAHIGFFKSLDDIARVKSELLQTLEGEGTAVLNFDDHRVRRMAEDFPGRVISFGFEFPAQVRAKNVVITERGTDFDLSLPRRTYHLKCPLPGKHNLANALAALAVASHLGINWSQIKRELRKFRLPPMRFQKIRIGGITLINDAYNANPASMRAALTTWKKLPVKGKRIFVSGDMNELGDFSEEEHRAWGQELGRAGLDYLVFFGPASRTAARQAEKAGFPGDTIFASDNKRAVAGFLREVAAAGDSILLKGSRVMALEEIIPLLRSQ